MKEKTGDTMAKVNLDCRSFLAGMLQLILLMPWCSVVLAEQDPTRGGIFPTELLGPLQAVGSGEQQQQPGTQPQPKRPKFEYKCMMPKCVKWLPTRDDICAECRYHDSHAAADERKDADWAEIRSDIDIDIARLFPEVTGLQQPEARQSVREILFAYCEANRELGIAAYRQGLHELAATLLIACIR